jgi:hypothetical protein
VIPRNRTRPDGGDAADDAAAVTQAAELQPDLVLMDVRMPALDGIAATRRIVDARPGSRFVILTTYDLTRQANGFLPLVRPARRNLKTIGCSHHGVLGRNISISLGFLREFANHGLVILQTIALPTELPRRGAHFTGDSVGESNGVTRHGVANHVRRSAMVSAR